MFSGVQVGLVGIVAVYLAKVLDEVRARPTYLVSDRIGLPFCPRTIWRRVTVAKPLD